MGAIGSLKTPMITPAKLELDGQVYELPTLRGTEGEPAVSIAALRDKTGHITLDDGYSNTGSCRSAITFIDGEKGILRYRGIPIEELARLGSAETTDEIVDSLKKRTNLAPLQDAIEELRCGCSVRQIENRLTRFKLEQMDRMSRRYPFSISPVLVYLERKYYEVYNLRAIARGKAANLAPERIQEYLVI